MNFYVPPAPAKKQMNWFFFVLAALSSVPAAFFGLVFFTQSQSGIALVICLWSAMWTAVWWSLRYR